MSTGFVGCGTGAPADRLEKKEPRKARKDTKKRHETAKELIERLNNRRVRSAEG